MTIGWRYVCLLLLALPLLLSAETRVFTEFVYDGSGNIVGIQRNITQDPPVINSLSPELIRIGRTFTLVVSGDNLFGVDVIPQDANVSVSNVSASNTSVRFSVLASENTPVGEYTFTFSTVLGSATGSVNVRIPGPDLLIEPQTLALKPGESQQLDIRLTSADSFENVLSLSVGNDSVISVSPETLTIPLGDTVSDSTVTVTAIADGNSSVSLNASALGNFGIPVFVNEGFVPSADGNEFFAASVSVFRDQAAGQGPFVSGSDGVTVFRDPATEAGPFVTGSDGVTVFRDPETEAGPFVTGSDGVTVFRDPATEAGPFVSQSDDLALLRDNVATGLVPSEVIANNIAVVLSVSGVGLDSVTEVTVSPTDDITFGAFSVNSAGNELTIPIIVSASAALGERQITLMSPSGPLVFRITGSSTGVFSENSFGIITVISN